MNVFSIIFMIVTGMALAGEKTGAKTFGTMEPASARQVSLSEAIKGYDKYKGQNILMAGKVQKVCQMSGCWFEMADGKDKVRITMKDYGFTVPKDIVDKSVKVVGLMEQKELPVKVVKHYMKDEGLPQSEIDKVKEPKKVFEFVATGVELQ